MNPRITAKHITEAVEVRRLCDRRHDAHTTVGVEIRLEWDQGDHLDAEVALRRAVRDIEKQIEAVAFWPTPRAEGHER